MKRVFAWQTDTSTCHLYRTQFPFMELAKLGWYVEWGAPPPNIRDFDVIVGQRLAGHNDLWLELAEDFKGLLVYDLDDDLVDVDPENTVPYSIYQPAREGTMRNIMAADVVTVSTPHLAEKISKINPEVVVLPNCIHESWLNQAIPNGPTVGWAGSPFHGQDFQMHFIGAMFRLRERHPEVRFHTMGGHYLGNLTHKRTGYQPMEHALRDMDFWVGLAPLKRCEFNESKSWCKALEYACRGIPIVASDVGQYPQWLGESGGGLLVREGDRWDEVIEYTLDPDWRAKAASAAYAKAAQWTIDKKVHLWEAVYNREW
jgi:glycosyltransferase involved in cell wall biosynthesis